MLKKGKDFFKKSDIKKNYEIGDTLGTGNFAVVKLGIHKETKTTWALKMIDKSKVESMEELQREIDILKMADSPHIIQLKEIFDAPKTLTLVTELATGGELFDRIVARGSYTEKDAAFLMGQLANGMLYIHGLGIVHRDLKPENLLYATEADDADIKIADFGLARIVTEKSMMNTACGTPGYVAPEILRNQGYDEAVDNWSLGVILYILLCGFPPFYEEDLPALFEQILEGRYDFPSPWWDNISSDAKNLVQRLLTVEKSKRATCKDILAHPWVKSTAPDTHLDTAQKAMRKYNASRKMKKAAMGIMAAKRLERAMQLSSS